ncbi:hypothetical protein WJX72_010457 [[Myrmecia] bisecta]|uniref:Secreted protein n=1 Tax=[Myrmecia] bisecta TaxID=41462 RepID=A0AAW1PT84_9CHLO
MLTVHAVAAVLPTETLCLQKEPAARLGSLNASGTWSCHCLQISCMLGAWRQRMKMLRPPFCRACYPPITSFDMEVCYM